MCENFTEIWQKRLSAKEEDQVALYHCVMQLAKRAKKMSFVTADEKESMLHDFYVYKLLPATERIDSNRIIKCSFIVQMMNYYLIDQQRKWKKDIKLTQRDINTSMDEFTEPDNHLEISKTILDNSKYFLDSLDKRMLRLIIYHFHRDKKYLKGIKSPNYSAIKLGIKRKKGQHINDYHKTTLIGQWLVKTYGRKILPLEESFLKNIFKSFEVITLVYIESGNFQNN
ncbi:MAG: hypothetical protein HAW67_00245 [Endozoicomonadaceae bacterium]|nr:hypothetical protein [Endozoicomonadaceae bacterium]